MKKSYIFDFDGTLVNSMPYYGGAMLSLLDEHNIKYESDIIKTITPLGFMGTAKYFISLGIPMTIDEIREDLGGRLYKVYSKDIPAKESVIDTLTELKNRGFELNVLSAGPHVTMDVCAKRLGIDKLVTNIWSSDDFDTTKADPDIYKRAAAKLGVDVSDVVFFDDNIDALRTAKSAGMAVCGVYDESSHEYRDDIKSLCDGYVHTMSEALDLEF